MNCGRRMFSKSARILYKDLSQSGYYKLLLDSAPLSHQFNLNNLTLKQHFLQKQKQFHPDKLGADTDHNNHANISSQINKSYETLLNPLSRAVHLLELNGIEIAEADSIQDTSLLIEVLDLREQLEDAETEDQVAELRQENQESITQTIQHLSQAFQDQDLQQAKNFTIKLRYLTNLDTAARDWQPNTPITLHH